MKKIIFLLLGFLLCGCSFLVKDPDQIDEWIFVQSQLYRIHLTYNTRTGEYYTVGYPAEEPEKGDRIFRLEYDYLQYSRSICYYRPSASQKFADEVRRNLEDSKFEKTVEKNRSRDRQIWIEQGNLFEYYSDGRLCDPPQ